MNTLLIVVGLVWLGFCICLVAFFWARPKKNESDPFLAATSGGKPYDTRNSQNSDLDDTLRQMDSARIAGQRDALRQNILSNAPKAMAGFAVVLLAVFAAYKLGVFTSGRERYTVSRTTFGIGNSTRGFSMGNKKFYVRAGQAVEVSYSIQSGPGRLYLSVAPELNLLQPGSFDRPPTWSQSVAAVGNWSAVVPVPQSGYYRLNISPSPERSGSMVYDVSWKVQ